MEYFLDTYAIIEIFSGNENFKKYPFGKEQVVCTIFNLCEAHFHFLKTLGSEKADKIYELIKPIVVPTEDFIIRANIFKLLHQKTRFSFADCVGYTASQQLGLKFVTGDYAFKGMHNVEFVK